MAEQQQQQQQQQPLQSPFPAPPPFYNHFTKANLSQLRRAQKEANNTEGLDTSSLLDLPTELRYLIPPPPPSPTASYRTFGNTIDPATSATTTSTPTLPDPIYPSNPANPQPQLLALVRSLMTTYLSLTHVLSANPSLYESKTRDLEMLVKNIHHLINRYRPHQARETLIEMMERRVRGLREEVGAIERVGERVGRVVEGLVRDEGGGGGVGEGEGIGEVVREGEEGGEGRLERQRRAWAAIEELD